VGAEPVEKMDRESKNVRKGNSNIVVSSVCDGSGGVGEAGGGLIEL